MKAVLAHEMGHIAGSHIKVKTFFSSAQLLVHLFKDMAWESFKNSPKQENNSKKKDDKEKNNNSWTYLLAYLGLAAVDLFLLSSVSRALEYDADRIASEYGLGKELIRALSKISDHGHGSFGVFNFFSETFSSHPSLANRERSIKFHEDTKEAGYGTYFRELAKFTAFEWTSAFQSHTAR
jgi:Zn-dependent protease with chaperone function